MEGAPHTAKRTIDVLWGCPLTPYIKEGRRRRPARTTRTKRGEPYEHPAPRRVRPVPGTGGGKGERGEREREKGGGVARDPLLGSPNRTRRRVRDPPFPFPHP